MSVEISHLANGLTVVTDPMAAFESAGLGVWVNAGARNERRQEMGISHMLEHMAFKGTTRRSARDISFEIEAVGGILNAYTGREQTAYHARVLKDDVALAFDLIADILTDPTYAAAELERERAVILQEIGEAADTPDDLVFDLLQMAAFADQPMGWPILGEEDTVAGMSGADLFAYRDLHYHAGNMIVAAAGAVNHADILALAEEKLAAVAPGAPETVVPARFAGGEIRRPSDLEQAHIAIALAGVAAGDADYFVAQVYAAALGGGMSSRLFQEVREKRGLCYSIYAFAQSVRDGGLIGIYAGTGAAGAGEIGPVIAGEMAALAEAAEDEEVARAKTQLKAGLLMGLEQPAAHIEMIAGHVLHYGRVLTVADLVAKLDAVTAADVRRFGSGLMNAGRPALATVGPADRFEDYDRFCGRFGFSAKGVKA
jgi:predicted Zn-dependent peptidase